ncbi:hypothetical protein VZT92_001249 [Zoarces viviparus]|uniref:Uncharacterized protein n=1 Tax=Zoarces viviparus TaxID=48416 RepID=A0AAW1G3L5_ZOAVI
MFAVITLLLDQLLTTRTKPPQRPLKSRFLFPSPNPGEQPQNSFTLLTNRTRRLVESLEGDGAEEVKNWQIIKSETSLRREGSLHQDDSQYYEYYTLKNTKRREVLCIRTTLSTTSTTR